MQPVKSAKVISHPRFMIIGSALGFANVAGMHQVGGMWKTFLRS